MLVLSPVQKGNVWQPNMIKDSFVWLHIDVVLSGQTVSNMRDYRPNEQNV